MPGELFYIPLTLWVRGAIEKMEENGKQDFPSWQDYWYQTYQELGGKSVNSGTKGCPMYGAYGLWRMGKIKDTKIPHRQIPIKLIYQELLN